MFSAKCVYLSVEVVVLAQIGQVLLALIAVGHLQGAPVDVLYDDFRFGAMAAVEVIDGHLGVDAAAVDTDIVAVEAGDAVDNPCGILHLPARRAHD